MAARTRSGGDSFGGLPAPNRSSPVDRAQAPIAEQTNWHRSSNSLNETRRSFWKHLNVPKEDAQGDQFSDDPDSLSDRLGRCPIQWEVDTMQKLLIWQQEARTRRLLQFRMHRYLKMSSNWTPWFWAVLYYRTSHSEKYFVPLWIQPWKFAASVFMTL
jgi:hypothetical protein